MDRSPLKTWIHEDGRLDRRVLFSFLVFIGLPRTLFSPALFSSSFGSSVHLYIIHSAPYRNCYKASLVSSMVELQIRSAVGGLLSDCFVSPSFVWSVTMTSCFSHSCRASVSFLFLLAFVYVVLQNVDHLSQAILCCLLL